jgi:hypothetical protein
MTEPDWTRADEQVIGRLVANHIQDGRAIEGRLYLTSQRLMFVPWPAGVARGGISCSIPWANFAGAGVAERGSGARDGSLRRRLRVTTVSGQAEFYVVWRPEKVARQIEDARPG